MINLYDCEFKPRNYPGEYSVYLNDEFVGILRKLDFIAVSYMTEHNQQINDEFFEYIKLKWC